MLDNLNVLNSFCIVFGIDFKDKICDIYFILDDFKGIKNISDDIIGRLCVII